MKTYKKFGYDKYEDYLEGSEWDELHEFCFQHVTPYECRRCGRTRGLNLHKLSYRFLSVPDLRKHYWFEGAMIHYLKKNFKWLCNDCNWLAHHYDNGDMVPVHDKFLKERYRTITGFWYNFVRMHPSEMLYAIYQTFSP